MKITLVPNTDDFYDRKQLYELAAEFKNAGYQTETFDQPITDISNKVCEQSRISPKAIEENYKNLKTDILFEVNRIRAKSLNKKTRHISWFQDLKPSEIDPFLHYNETKKTSDLVYLLGDKKHFGLSSSNARIGSLFTGLNEEQLRPNNLTDRLKPFDLNLTGYYPAFPINSTPGKKESRATILLKEIIRRPRLLYEIVFNKKMHLNLERFKASKFFGMVNNHIKLSYKPLGGLMPSAKEIQPKNKIDALIYDLLYVEQPRLIDRAVLFNILKKLHLSGKKILITGKNWNSAFPDHEFILPHSETPVEIFSKSKITLHNNTHGIGIHSRVLEAMAAGSFIMMHASPHSGLPGGIDSSFLPDVHYGLYTKDNLAERVEHWLEQGQKRENAIEGCRGILRDRHLWRHRVSQILEDLH